MNPSGCSDEDDVDEDDDDGGDNDDDDGDDDDDDDEENDDNEDANCYKESLSSKVSDSRGTSRVVFVVVMTNPYFRSIGF